MEGRAVAIATRPLVWDFEAAFADALAALLRDLLAIDEVAEVTGWEEYEHRGGVCSTCEYPEVRVR